MICTKCGVDNAPGAETCASCGADITLPAMLRDFQQKAAATPPYVPGTSRPQTSGLAIASLVLGGLSILCGGFLAPVGLILGIVALLQIRANRDRLEGGTLAVIGVALSGVGALILLVTLSMVDIPVFSRAQGKAAASSCMSNQKQVALALLMYSQDYDEHFPMKDSWCDATMPYIKNQAVFQCPALPDEPCGYALNADLSQVAMAKVTDPSQTVMTFDATGGWNLSGGVDLADPRHDGAANVAFADGHVKGVERSDLNQMNWQPTQKGEDAGS